MTRLQLFIVDFCASPLFLQSPDLTKHRFSKKVFQPDSLLVQELLDTKMATAKAYVLVNPTNFIKSSLAHNL